MGIGYSRPSRPAESPSNQLIPPLGISSKVNEAALDDSAIAEQRKRAAAGNPLLAVVDGQHEHQARASDIMTVPITEQEVADIPKKTKSAKSPKTVSTTAKRPYSALDGDASAEPSKPNQRNQSSQPLLKRPKKAPATSAYVTEPVVLARPRKSARLENASRALATNARSTPKASVASLASIASKAAIEREDGELTDEDLKSMPESPLPPIPPQPVPPLQKSIPTKPAADSRRPRYLDRDALPSRPAAVGKAGFSSQKPRKVDPITAVAPFISDNKQALPRPRLQDTSSGLPYDDIYAAPAPSAPTDLGRQSNKHILWQDDPPYSPRPKSRMHDVATYRMDVKGLSDRGIQAVAGSSGSHAYAIAPHFYQQYTPFSHLRSGQEAERQTGGPRSQDGGIHHDQYRGRCSEDDDDMEDQAAERAAAENDRLGLEQARKWAQEQSARHEHKLDETGIRELVQLLLQLKSWGVPTTEFVRRGVPLSLLRAIHAVISTNRSARSTPPPPPPPITLPPPPPPQIMTRDRPRRDSIASSVEMDIATPTPSPEIKPHIHSVISSDVRPSGLVPTTAQVEAQILLHGDRPLQRDMQAESLQPPEEASSGSVNDQEAEARHAREVSAIRVKLLAAKLRKQKEIKARLRKLQEDAAVAVPIVPPALIPAQSPEIKSPELEETLIQLLQMSSPAPVLQAEPISKPASTSTTFSPNLASKRLRNGSNRAKLSDLVDQPAVVADSSSYFPTKARSTHVRRTTLAPPHPKHFVINLDTDSESEDEERDPLARAAVASKEMETRNADALKREIELKLAARAALEARIAAMEARKQAKKRMASVLQKQQPDGLASPSEPMIEQAVINQPVDMSVDVLETSVDDLAMKMNFESAVSRDEPSQVAMEVDGNALSDQLGQASDRTGDYMQVPAMIAPGTEDVLMRQADEEQTETEMLREALIMSSYDNHARCDPDPVDFDRDQEKEQNEGNAENIIEPQLAISHPRAREPVGSESAIVHRDVITSPDSQEQEQARRFTSYESLTNKIPLTAAQLVKIRTPGSVSAGSGLLYRDTAGKLDPSILEAITWSRIHETRRNFVLCKYEDGSGICADVTCSDLHMSRDVVPTPQDLLKLINIVLPPSSSAHPTLQQAILAIPETPAPVTDYANRTSENGRADSEGTFMRPGEPAGHWPDRLNEAMQTRARAVDDFLELVQKAIDS